jgi:hypothetical protein
MGKEVWMTEHLDTATSWTAALATGKEIHDCMLANYNAYIWWYIRRFYGPLLESGSISKRGYVMSQFAKFVRPGFKRIEATVNPISNVFISSFKKDTNVVIVVVNQNPAPADLDFTLQNASTDHITKFTTSDDKNLLNEGTISVTENTFSTTFDARSITTLTTNTSNGGRAFNSPPVANAGTDGEYTDDDNNGMEYITLDASSSSDPDGTITNYTWSEAGKQVASGVQAEVSLYTGTHSILLTITDNDGATDTNSVTIVISLGGGTNEANIRFEAECGTVGSNWNISSDVNASGDKYVSIQSGNNSIDSPSQSSDDHILFTFDIVEAGNYILWGRTRVPTPDDDSFWVRMDDGTWAKSNSISGGTNWEWDDVHNSDMGSEVVSYNLVAGTHTLTIGYREDSALLDKLYLTNTGTVPSGLGGVAGNCIVEATENDILPDNISGTYLSVNYPNPFSERTLVELGMAMAGHVTLELLDVTGRKIRTLLNDVLQPGEHEVILEGSQLESGIYFLRLQTGDFNRTRRILINR